MIPLFRNITLLSFLLFLSFMADGQNINNIDSLKNVLNGHKNDTNKVKLLYTLSFAYDAGSYADTALVYPTGT